MSRAYETHDGRIRDTEESFERLITLHELIDICDAKDPGSIDIISEKFSKLREPEDMFQVVVDVLNNRGI